MTGLFDLCVDKFEVFSHFLAMTEVDSGAYMLEINKNA